MAKGYVESLLGENERVLLVSRQHWFNLIGSILLEIIVILLIIAITATAAAFIPPVFPTLTPGLISVIGAILLLFPIATLLRDVLNWINLQYIVTNRRVMQVTGVFNKSVTDSSLEKVNDVHMRQSALGRLFDYGDVEILTASELGVNLFRRIQNPIHFKTTMINAKENMDRDDDGRTLRPRPGEDVPSLIASLEQLRQQGVLSEEEFQQKKTDLLARM